jgi:hypothetical protein
MLALLLAAPSFHATFNARETRALGGHVVGQFVTPSILSVQKLTERHRAFGVLDDPSAFSIMACPFADVRHIFLCTCPANAYEHVVHACLWGRSTSLEEMRHQLRALKRWHAAAFPYHQLVPGNIPAEVRLMEDSGGMWDDGGADIWEYVDGDDEALAAEMKRAFRRDEE